MTAQEKVEVESINKESGVNKESKLAQVDHSPKVDSCCKKGESCCKNNPVEEEKEVVQKRCEELTRTVQYVQAEFENYRKRVDRDRDSVQKFAARSALQNILSVVDSFELALIPTENQSKGFELVYSQFIDCLKSCGVVPMVVIGQKFDPRFHEALLQEPSKSSTGTILEELQRGWFLHDVVLRPAKVKVAQ